MLKRLKNGPEDRIPDIQDEGSVQEIVNEVMDNYQRKEQLNALVNVPDKITNNVLSYSIEANNSYLSLIRNSIMEGMPPLVSQESVFDMADVSALIKKIETVEERMPDDYVAPASASVSSENDDVEVDII
jgi:hypothetical protein